VKKLINILLPVAVFLLSLSTATMTPFSWHAVPSIESGVETAFSNPDASDIPIQLPVGQRAYLLDTLSEKESVDSQNNVLKLGSGKAIDPLRVPEVVFASRIVDFGFELKKVIYPFHFFF